MRLRVNEIFASIQGEGTRAGRPCIFVRLTGCPFRCAYCDTTYAYDEGDWREAEEVLEAVRTHLGAWRPGPEAAFIEVTGGEPLAQPGTPDLLRRLQTLGPEVALETSGGCDLSSVPQGIVKVVDRKTPGSGQAGIWLPSNLGHLAPGRDELKFVLCSPEDYAWALACCRAEGLWERLTVLFSPAAGLLEPAWLAERIVADRVPVRFQLQLHKYVWDPARRGV